MASQFPAALDTVSTLPTVRNGATDINANLINGLRDAILAVERALGINPQGTYSDLATRLAMVIMPDGSLNKSALIATGFIAGPITDADVSPNAAISELKLNLAFPTSLLQNEISILDAQQAGLIQTIQATNSTLQAHITGATGVHRAAAIATDVQNAPISSTTATKQITDGNVQLALQTLYSGHINWGAGPNNNLLSLTNSPHQADQIFYDNRNTELPTSSVQGAIDNIFADGTAAITDHQRQLHSNGIQRRVEETDTENTTGTPRGRLIISAFLATIQYPNANADTSIFINIPIQSGATVAGVDLLITNLDGTTEAVPVDVDDSLQITDGLGNIYNLIPITDLRIVPVVNTATNVSTNYLVGLEVFYNPDVFSALFSANGVNDTNAQLQITCSVFKKIDTLGNGNALNCVARVLKPNSVIEPDLSSSVSEVQVAQANAATIVSSGFNSSALGRRADGYFDRNFSSVLTIVVDGSNTYQIQIVPNSPVDITLDTCVAKANLEFLQQNVPLTAYRMGEEMAISHNWPDDIFIAAGTHHTIRIVSGGGVDASTAAGFAYTTNITVYGSAGNNFVINGVQRSAFRIKLPLDDTAALGAEGFSVLGNVIVLNDASNNPLAAGVRAGDIVNLQGLTSASTSANLNGSYRISTLTSNTITIDGNPFPVDVQLSDTATMVVYSNVVSLDNLAHRFQTDFAGLDPSFSQNVLVQIFMNSNGELDYHERLLYPNAAFVSGNQYGGTSNLAMTNLTTDDHGVYIIDCNRALIGSAQGDLRLISFQFDNQKRVFATFGCQSSPNDGYSISASLVGPAVNITGNGKYNLVDETGLNYITVQSVSAFNLLSDTILSTIPDGQYLTYVLPVVKFEQVNEFENLLLCQVYYNSQVNQIPILNGDLALSDKRYTGTLGAEQIRDDVIEQYVSGPMGETRGSGVVSGLFVPSDPTATNNKTNDKVVYTNGGVVYVQGVRYAISSQQTYVDPATLDISQYGTDGYLPGTGAAPNGDGSFKNGYIRYYVFVDNFGRLQTTSSLNLPAATPFVPLAKVNLTTRGILNNSPNIISVNVIDFRLWISDIDDKIEIVVGSVEQQPAHFHSITAAVEYIDNLRYNDIITGSNLHVRPTIIRLLEGVYQEATTVALPPYTTLRGESSRSVRIRPPVSLLTTNIQLNDSADKNRYIFSASLLPEGITVKIENVCFDLNVTTTPATASLTNTNNIGAIRVVWFDNTSASTLIPSGSPLASSPSTMAIEGCLFIMDGPYRTTGITTVFSSSTPIITGGLYSYSYNYGQLFTSIALGKYVNYQTKVTVPFANTQRPLPPTSLTSTPPPVAQPVTENSIETGPPPPDGVHVPPAVLQTNPGAPFSPEDAIFTDPNAPVGFNQGGMMNIANNTFIITDGYGSICVDRFYDTTIASGYTSATPIPVSNTRMMAFKVVNNSFRYVNSTNPITNKITLGSNGIINTTTPVNTNPNSGFLGGQESLRDQMYDLMIHRDLRGFAPYIYPNGFVYPDPKDGYGIPDGYYVPPAGGKVTEFMIISGNTPSGLNIPEATPIRFATETQDSLARDQHGGGTVFGSITIPYTGLPVVLDRSMDWHDRYVFIYATDVLTNSNSSLISAAMKNVLYTSPIPISQINTSVSFVPDTILTTNMNAQSADKATSAYGANALGASHALAFGYVSRLSGDLITISNPATIQMPGWSQVKYLGTMQFSDVNNNISAVVMPNGELAVLHAGKQDPNGTTTNAKLVQTSDSYPGFPDAYGRPPDGYGGSQGNGTLTTSKTISFVIQYSPKLNILTTSQTGGANTNNLDNSGGGFGSL